MGCPTAETADLRHPAGRGAGLFRPWWHRGHLLRDIAKEAGVTPALVHYYFGDTAQLQEAVVTERLLPVVAKMGARR